MNRDHQRDKITFTLVIFALIALAMAVAKIVELIWF